MDLSRNYSAKVSMVVELISIIFYLALLYYMVEINRQEIHVIWVIDLIYFALLGGLSFLYLRYGKRKQIFS